MMLPGGKAAADNSPVKTGDNYWCPMSNDHPPNDAFGFHRGENDDGFAGLTVLAYVGNATNGATDTEQNPDYLKPLNVSFRLHSQLPDLSNWSQSPDHPPAGAHYINRTGDPDTNIHARLFKLDSNNPVRGNDNTIGRTAQHQFNTGTNVYTAAGDSADHKFTCNGLMVAGPGVTYTTPTGGAGGTGVNIVREYGNRWALDCQEAWTGPGGAHGVESTRFWITDIQGQGDGYWEVQVGQSYPWSTDYNAGSTNGSPFSSSPKTDFTVTNGATQHVYLIWHPTPKVKKAFGSDGACTYASVTTDNNYFNHPKRTHVQIYGISLGKEIKKHLNGSTWIKDQEQDYSSDPADTGRPRSVDAYVPSEDGQLDGNTMKLWYFLPWESNTVKIVKTTQYAATYSDTTADHIPNPHWHDWTDVPNSTQYYNGSGWQGSDTSVTCYSGYCHVTSVTGDGPSGEVVTQTLDGSPGHIYIHATLTNTSRDGLQLWGEQLIGTGGTFSKDTVLPSGSTTNFDIQLGAPSSAQYYRPSYYPNYPPPGGGGQIGGNCDDISVPVYEPFTLVPHADRDYTGTQEYPRTITYDTYVQNNSSKTIPAPSSSKFTYTPYGAGTGCPNTGPVGTPAGQFAPGGPDYTIGSTTCTPTSYEAGDKYCVSISLTSYNQGYVGPGGELSSTSLNYNNASDEKCLKIINEPYFKVYGTGVSAGGSFSSGNGVCTGGGLLAGYSDNADAIPRGTGSELSALALIKITGVASAQGAYPTSSPPGTALTFANTNAADISSSLDSPSLGGNYDPGGSHCLTDQKPKSGAIVHDGPYTIGATNVGDNTSVFVNGDVRITGDITYTGSWTIDKVPSFVLHATGNIYIDPGVTQLDGVYIAGKTIYTCDNHSFTPMPASSMYAGCKNQLVFNGSVTATKVNMQRTFGSLRDERPTGATPSVSVTRNGRDYDAGTCYQPGQTPTTENSCFADGNSVTDWENYQARYSFDGMPARNDYKLTVNYRNFPNGPWPPPTSTGYSYKITVYVNGVARTTQSVSASGSTATFNLGNLPANPKITISGYNNYWIPYGGNPSAYDPNFEIKTLTLESPGSPATVPVAPACSNKGIQRTTRTCAAEIFNFSPELYLSTPVMRLPSNGALQYDAVTSLPPVL